MNYKEVCEIPITDYLSALGIFSSTINKTDAWYCSPIRKENTPSFHVNLYKNNWYDHGIGQGGNILTLVMMMSNISVNEALVKIENYRTSKILMSSWFVTTESNRMIFNL